MFILKSAGLFRIGDRTYIHVGANEVRDILSKAIHVDFYFNEDSYIADFFKSMFSDWLITLDTAIVQSKDLKIYYLTDLWYNLMAKEGLRYMFYSDCDDFAHAFKSYVSLKTGSNNVMVVYGIVRHGDEIYGHAWNLIFPLFLLREDPLTVSTMPLYYEPQLNYLFIPNYLTGVGKVGNEEYIPYVVVM